jgi:hypothetical protein
MVIQSVTLSYVELLSLFVAPHTICKSFQKLIPLPRTALYICSLIHQIRHFSTPLFDLFDGSRSVLIVVEGLLGMAGVPGTIANTSSTSTSTQQPSQPRSDDADMVMMHQHRHRSSNWRVVFEPSLCVCLPICRCTAAIATAAALVVDMIMVLILGTS